MLMDKAQQVVADSLKLDSHIYVEDLFVNNRAHAYAHIDQVLSEEVIV